VGFPALAGVLEKTFEGHAGRPGKRGGSLPRNRIGNAQRAISLVKKFYREEEAGEPHSQEFLDDVGFELADIIENISHNWTPVLGVFSGREENDADILRRHPGAAAIDTAINGLHQALLDAADPSGESSEEMLNWGADLRDYLLGRAEPPEESDFE